MPTPSARRCQPMLFPALIFFTLSMPLWAGGAQVAAKAESTPAVLYQSYCSVCHGDQGNGQSRARNSLNPPPTDFTQPAARVNLPPERMIAAVRDGRPGTAMVGWKSQLSSAQIVGVVEYVRATFMPAAAAAVSAPATTRSAPVKLDLQGNHANGRRLYDQNCVACHGKEGDGKGPRAYFISPSPRSFISADSRKSFGRAALVFSIAEGKRGREMPAWSKVMTDQQIADVAEYVYQQFIVGPRGSGEAK